MATWRVMRQDDNGNVFVVADGLAEDIARELCATLEARGHKQLYFVERTPSPSPGARAAWARLYAGTRHEA